MRTGYLRRKSWNEVDEFINERINTREIGAGSIFGPAQVATGWEGIYTLHSREFSNERSCILISLTGSSKLTMASSRRLYVAYVKHNWKSIVAEPIPEFVALCVALRIPIPPQLHWSRNAAYWKRV